MVADGEYVAVLDRIEEGERDSLAVLLLERDDRQVDELVVPVADLPPEAEQDAVFRVSVADDELADATYLPEETSSRTESAQDRYDRLARRPPSVDDEDEDDSAHENP